MIIIQIIATIIPIIKRINPKIITNTPINIPAIPPSNKPIIELIIANMKKTITDINIRKGPNRTMIVLPLF
jgi:hypothetical protein